MSSLFKSEHGKNEILTLYDQKLSELKGNIDSIYLETSFGTTHILKSGHPSLPPLILIHGSNGCAPIGLECYPNLIKKYQVFAIDVLAQPNRSAETRLSMKNNAYGQWVHELISKLDLEEVTLAGFSFGGLIILKTLIHNNTKIKDAFLASPAYIVNGNPLNLIFKVFIPMRRYMMSKRVKYVEKFLSSVFTQRDEFAIKFLSKVFLYFIMDFTPVPTISKNDAARITTPIYILGAGRDIIFPGVKMEKRAISIFPSLKKFVFLPESKHVQDNRGNVRFEELIMNKN